MNKQYVATFSSFEAALTFLSQLVAETNPPMQGYSIEPLNSGINTATASRQWIVGKLN